MQPAIIRILRPRPTVRRVYDSGMTCPTAYDMAYASRLSYIVRQVSDSIRQSDMGLLSDCRTSVGLLSDFCRTSVGHDCRTVIPGLWSQSRCFGGPPDFAPLRRPPIVQRQPAIVPGVSWHITKRDQLPGWLRLEATGPQRRPDRSRCVSRCAPEGAERPSSVVELRTGLSSRPAITLAHATALTMFMETYPSMARIRANDAPFCTPALT